VNLLIVSQYFWPESFRITDLARSLSREGVEVKVLTGVPNYPEGEIFDGYSMWSPSRQTLGEIEIFRVPLVPRKQGRALRLVANYLSFVFFASTLGLWRLRGQRVDAIFVYGISPILQAIPAILMKWRKRAKLIIWVQDLWPDALEATGFVKNRYLLALCDHVVRWIYRHADLVMVQSHAFIEPVSRLCPRERVVYYPNSAEDVFSNEESKPPCPVEGLDHYFSIVFAGSLGTAQALEVILDAAENLQTEARIRFFLVGHGSRSDWLQTEVKRRGLINVVLTGRYPTSLMPSIFEKSSALLVTLTDEPIFAQTIPSKVQSYLAAGRPILGCINGEGARVIQEACAGLTSAAMNSAELAKNVRLLFAMSEEERDVLGRNGKSYFLKNFESRRLTLELTKHLDALVGSGE